MVVVAAAAAAAAAVTAAAAALAVAVVVVVEVTVAAAVVVAAPALVVARCFQTHRNTPFPFCVVRGKLFQILGDVRPHLVLYQSEKCRSQGTNFLKRNITQLIRSRGWKVAR